MSRAFYSFLLIALASSAPLLAHHSFAAEYDDTKPIKVMGTVTKVEWQNPHIWFYLDVKGEDGKVTNYAFSGGAPGQLMRRGDHEERDPGGFHRYGGRVQGKGRVE